jgi:hypothetical protein
MFLMILCRRNIQVSQHATRGELVDAITENIGVKEGIRVPVYVHVFLQGSYAFVLSHMRVHIHVRTYAREPCVRNPRMCERKACAQ